VLFLARVVLIVAPTLTLPSTLAKVRQLGGKIVGLAALEAVVLGTARITKATLRGLPSVANGLGISFGLVIASSGIQQSTA